MCNTCFRSEQSKRPLTNLVSCTYLEEKGISGVIGSKDASREAFKVGLIEEGEDWMNMIKARNLTSHTYNANVANEIVNNILQHFYPAFKSMAKKFTSLYEKQD